MPARRVPPMGAVRVGHRVSRRPNHVPFAVSVYVVFVSIAMSNTRHTGVHAAVGEASAGSSGLPVDRDLRPVPFVATPMLGGFDETDPRRKQTIPTTTGGVVTWRGGFELSFPGTDEGGSHRPWNDFGGWSTLVGNGDGTELWTLTDTYAYLLKLDVTVDPTDGTLTNVSTIKNARFNYASPEDATRIDDVRGYADEKNEENEKKQRGNNDGAAPVAKRVDLESIVVIPHNGRTEGEHTESGKDSSDSLLADFAVGVEDSRELPENDLIRFQNGRRGKWQDVPGADSALNACDRNLGPEALVWLPSGSAGSDGTGDVLVTFCETPSVNSTKRRDAVAGFIFGVDGTSKDADDSDSDTQTPNVRRFELVNVDRDCGLSDASVTPDGKLVLLLYHCYSYPPGKENRFGTGTHSTQIRVARVRELLSVPNAVGSSESHPSHTQLPLPSVRARLLAKWSGAEHCAMTNMEGLHVVAGPVGDDSLDLIMVSDNNLGETDPTQIVRVNLKGVVDVSDEVDLAMETKTARKSRAVFATTEDGEDGDEEVESSLDTSLDSSTTTAKLGLPKLGSSWFEGLLGNDKKKNLKNETETETTKSLDDYDDKRITNARRDAYLFNPDIETGIDFLDDAITDDEEFLGRLRGSGGRRDALVELAKERKGILYQLRAMSLFTVAATLTMSAIVAIAALAAHSVARKARNAGSVEELRPLGVSGGVAYPKPYGYSEEYEYDAV
jgi:hypothetical protein